MDGNYNVLKTTSFCNVNIFALFRSIIAWLLERPECLVYLMLSSTHLFVCFWFFLFVCFCCYFCAESFVFIVLYSIETDLNLMGFVSQIGLGD